MFFNNIASRSQGKSKDIHERDPSLFVVRGDTKFVNRGSEVCKTGGNGFAINSGVFRLRRFASGATLTFTDRVSKKFGGRKIRVVRRVSFIHFDWDGK